MTNLIFAMLSFNFQKWLFRLTLLSLINPIVYSTEQQIPTDLLDFMRSTSLARHNQYRRKHDASDLALDDAINGFAQIYAQYLAANNIFEHSGNKMYGENLFKFCAFPFLPNFKCNYLFFCLHYELLTSNCKVKFKAEFSVKILAIILNATDAWYNEVKYYDFNRPDFSEATGHFTQLVWKGSKNVGFGLALGETNGFICVYLVANYYPPGNVLGRFGQNVLKSNELPNNLCMPKRPIQISKLILIILLVLLFE